MAESQIAECGELVDVQAPSDTVELELVLRNMSVLVNVEEVEALDLGCFSGTNTSEEPLPENLVASDRVNRTASALVHNLQLSRRERAVSQHRLSDTRDKLT